MPLSSSARRIAVYGVGHVLSPAGPPTFVRSGSGSRERLPRQRGPFAVVRPVNLHAVLDTKTFPHELGQFRRRHPSQSVCGTTFPMWHWVPNLGLPCRHRAHPAFRLHSCACRSRTRSDPRGTVSAKKVGTQHVRHVIDEHFLTGWPPRRLGSPSTRVPAACPMERHRGVNGGHWTAFGAADDAEA
jgi:hypothetical protein